MLLVVGVGIVVVSGCGEERGKREIKTSSRKGTSETISSYGRKRERLEYPRGD